HIEYESIACSFWSPPYHLGKSYEKYLSYTEWVDLLKKVIALHYGIIKPGGFLVINIADILVFPDKTMPRIQAMNINKRKSPITREQIVDAMEKHP
ncbi:MAG TPA: DNA methyltransferase, partial [Aggregatilineales bacterium]|nr:DNA methyltransferase [Aggregatilineales bacterium]